MKALLGLVLVSSGCMAGASSYGIRSSMGPASGGAPVESAPPPSEPMAAYAPGEDAQWFSADDYLVTKEVFHGQPLHYLKVAKMMEAPGATTKAEARFLTQQGDDLWTGSFWRTRVATPADAAVGALAFCHQDSGYRTETGGPRDKREARNEGWLVGRITDTSDAFKGRVSVGPMSCPIAAMRVPTR